MSYQALYRKWRPATFDEVRGQDAVVTTLKHQIVSDRIGHAYLFCGTRGTGKTSVAKIFSRAANCPNRMEHGGNPCNACEECRSIADGRSMNVFEIDAASYTGVDNIREIREQMDYPPSSGRFKIFIIDEVHMLSTNAFNALLKTLEEPPAYGIFILATTDPQKVPQTILSRCQRYDFRRITQQGIFSHLTELCRQENADVHPDALRYIAGLADGSMRDALSLLDQCLGYQREGALRYEDVLEIVGSADVSVYSELLRAVQAGKAEETLRITDRVLNGGSEVSVLITDFMKYLRSVFLYQSAGAGDLIEVPEDRLPMLEEDSRLLPGAELIGLMTALGELLNRCRFAPRKRVLLETELLRLSSGMTAGRADPRIRIALEQPVREAPEAAPKPGSFRERLMAESRQEAPKPAQREEKPAPAEEKPAPPEEKPAPERTETAAAAQPAPAGAPAAEQPEAAAGKLEIVRTHWDELTAGLSPANRALFKSVGITEERGNIVLVFKNMINFRMASSNTDENGLIRLRELCRERLGIAVPFLARPATAKEMKEEPEARVSDEDLARINFPVTFEKN